MDEMQRNDLSKFQANLELIARVLDLASHPVRSAFSRQSVFAARPELKDKFMEVMDSVNHLIEACRNISNPE